MDDTKPAQFYIATKIPPADERNRVLKYGQMFAVLDRLGDIELVGRGEDGIFFEGTRFLSHLALFIGNQRPLLLSSTVREDNSMFTADLTNVDITRGDHVVIPRGTVHLARSKTLWRDACYEQIRISSYALSTINISLTMQFDSDFIDLFEVRGCHRCRRGEHWEPEIKDNSVTLSYRGLDEVVRRSCIRFNRKPDHISAHSCEFDLVLHPKEELVLETVVSCLYDSSPERTDDFDTALKTNANEMRLIGCLEDCCLDSSNAEFNDWLHRSAADVRMMIVGNPEAEFPYAGVPWFSTVFGRDGVITALECLWLNPSIAKGVLQHLSATQAQEVNPTSEAEPGKILHEARGGEMAALGEVPFGLYYGSVDSTPLFIVLAGAYYQRTNDFAFIQSIWPNIEAALAWIDRYGDSDQDGFVEYCRRSEKGLVQQGWKDSNDSVFHADGCVADPPIALCEVQGYVYAAKRAAAQLATAMHQPERAAALESQARALKENFSESFWCPELGMYALALDGNKKPCRVRTSNPGHCLYSGIAMPEHAAHISRALLTPDFFSGWGVRTVAASESRYNPVSYHNGSVWPHDNAMIALGLSNYGFRDHVVRILSGLFDVSAEVDLHRLPELLCGLDRRTGEGPTLYPVACAPQAWAAGAVFMLLEACLGISIDARKHQLIFRQPCLPPAVPHLRVKQLQVNSGRVDLHFERRRDNEVRIDVTGKRGDVEVVVL